MQFFIATGNEVLFHQEVQGDSQGRFVTLTLTFSGSKESKHTQLWNYENETPNNKSFHSKGAKNLAPIQYWNFFLKEVKK